MKLWGTHLSPFLMRALFCARIKGIEIAVEPAPFDTKSPQFAAIAPLRRVPILVDGELRLPESRAICDYIEEAVAGPSIWPDDLAARSYARVICEIVDLYLFPEMCNLLLPAIAPGPTEGARDRFIVALDAVEFYLRPGRVWLVDDRPTMADGAIISTLVMVDALALPAGALGLLDDRPLLVAWWSRVKADPFARRGIAEQSAAFAQALASMQLPAS